MKVACTVWLGAKGVKASDLSRLLLKEEQTAAYSVEIWKRFRKWGGIPTAITQNVKDLLSSREVENIFENSDFVLMLNQAQGDKLLFQFLDVAVQLIQIDVRKDWRNNAALRTAAVSTVVFPVLHVA